jgi:uncharacterized membrane protein
MQSNREMRSTRLEAFSDGVLAILITIMVLELKVPHNALSLQALVPMGPIFLSYALSFVYIGIYWNNHHHMFQTVKKITGSILWANHVLMFFLSLIPFATAWMGENHFQSGPMAFYGLVLFACAVSYFILQYSIVSYEGRQSILKMALGSDLKGKVSPLAYLIAVGFAFYIPIVSGVIYLAVALMWLIPDPRIEKVLDEVDIEKTDPQIPK